MSVIWWAQLPITKHVCPACRKRTENFVLETSPGDFDLRCLKCGTWYELRDSAGIEDESVEDDAPDLLCYG